MPLRLRWPEISRALARHDAGTVYTLLRERLSRGAAGDALLELIRSQHDWPQPEPFDPTGTLSPRELEVLRLAARGLSVKQTARALPAATETVKSHQTHIRAKLGAHSMAAAVAIARERGLLA